MKKANTSDGYFRETFTYQGKRYSVRAKTERDLWRNDHIYGIRGLRPNGVRSL